MEKLESRAGWLVSLIYFFAWLVTAIGAVIDALAVREAILALLALANVIGTDAYHRRGGIGTDFLTTFGTAAVDNFMLLLLGCGAVAATIWIEYYYRKGRPKGLLFKRIGRVAVIEIAIIVAALIIRQLIGMVL